MNQTHRLLSGFGIAVLAFSLPVDAYQAPQERPFTFTKGKQGASSPLWRDRGNIETLDVFHGAGGKAHQPAGRFTFVKEDKDGTQPKFEVVDAQGVRWKAKLGDEAKSETAATRLVWAAGFYADEDYYLAELRVEKLPKLSRGSEFVSAGGVVRGVRLEREVKGQKKTRNWSWSEKQFEETREMNGLRIMMAILNNWDLKTLNNAVYEAPGEEPHYVVNDLGATFGRTGGVGDRTKSRLDDYTESKFIDRTEADEVDLTLKSRPIFLLAISPYHYFKLAAREKVGKNIPLEDAKWLGQLLGRLSAEQIRDCFRAAGYSVAEVEGFAKVVRGRIADLNKL